MRISIKGDLYEGICDHGEDCCPHHVTGEISECSGKMYSNGEQVALVGDKITHNCPHCGTATISSSTSNIYINGKQACGIGSIIEYSNGSGKITTAKGNIYND